jgi:tryptophan synthase beta subunit
MPALAELEAAYHRYKDEPDFNQELSGLLKDYVGRATPSILLNASPSTTAVPTAAVLRSI